MGNKGRVKKTATLGLKVYPEVKSRLESRAKLLQRSMNWLVGRYIEEGLERDEINDKGTNRTGNNRQNRKNDR